MPLTRVELQFDVPWPPSVNRYWRHGRGRVYLAPAGRHYIELVRQSMPLFHEPWETEDLRLIVMAHPPDRRKRDLDNILKALLDGLEKGSVFRDASQIKHIEARMLEPVRPNGLVHLIIGAIHEP